MPNLVRVWNHVVSVVTGFFQGDGGYLNPCTWQAHQTGEVSEASWDDYSTTGSDPTTWAEMVCPELTDGDGNQLRDQDGNNLIS